MGLGASDGVLMSVGGVEAAVGYPRSTTKRLVASYGTKENGATRGGLSSWAYTPNELVGELDRSLRRLRRVTVSPRLDPARAGGAGSSLFDKPFSVWLGFVMKFRRRKDKVMATQTEVSLPEPKLDDTGGWEFPDGWSEDDIRDWLTTHPEGRPQQLTLDIDPGLPPTEGDGGESGDLQADRDEYEKTYDQQQAEVVAKLKADGMVAAAYAVPPEQKDVITPENYDPREFLLVHYTVWDDVTSSMVEEERLTAENKELRKRVNALTRGIKKIQKHWSATKAELKKSVKL